jgi:hypothetical protein
MYVPSIDASNSIKENTTIFKNTVRHRIIIVGDFIHQQYMSHPDKRQQRNLRIDTHGKLNGLNNSIFLTNYLYNTHFSHQPREISPK